MGVAFVEPLPASGQPSPGQLSSGQLSSGQPLALRSLHRPVTLAGERLVPVLEPLAPLLPEAGLRRGSTVTVEGAAGGTSLALALIARVSAEGAWCAAVGAPALGLVAAAGLGVTLERFALVAAPPAGDWATVVAALVDAMAVVLVWPPTRVRAPDARRLMARARERGTVLLAVDGSWAEGADVRLRVTGGAWHGLGQGHGCLKSRVVDVTTAGRGAAARHRRTSLWLPAPGGGVASAPSQSPAIPEPSSPSQVRAG